MRFAIMGGTLDPFVTEPHAVAGAAALIADPARASMLIALAKTGRMAAIDLATAAGITPQTASSHLAKLDEAGLVTWRRTGRIRYYQLAGPAVTHVLHALAALTLRPEAAPDQGNSLVGGGADGRLARSCYDHLAGHLGVEIADSLLRDRVISRRAWSHRPVKNQSYGLTKAGAEYLRGLGMDPRYVRRPGRSFAHACIDRTEGRAHLGGSLGAALAGRLFDLGWIERIGTTRTLRVTPAGRPGLRRQFGIDV